VGAVLGLLATAWRWRRRFPLYAFAVLWFFASHLLESTVIPLELVFEHRNYLASAGIWFALAGLAPAIVEHVRPRLRVALAAFAGAYLLLVASVTWQITSLWGQPMLMADWWQQKLPESKRARLEFIAALIGYRFPDLAVQVSSDAAQKWPDHPIFNLLKIRIYCQFPDALPIPPAGPIARQFREMRDEQFTALYLVDSLLRYLEESSCKGLTADMLGEMIDAAFDNPTLARSRRNLLMVKMRVLRLQGRTIDALDRYREAVDMSPMAELALYGVVFELDAGRLDKAREYLAIAESDPRIAFADRWGHRADIEAARNLIELHQSSRAPAPATEGPR
jgi:protein O-mannosyl-transferase